MKPTKIKAQLKYRKPRRQIPKLAAPHLLAGLVALSVLSPEALVFAQPSMAVAAKGKEEATIGEPGAVAGKPNTPKRLIVSAILPPRKTSAGAFLVIGQVGRGTNVGFLLGGDLFYGWQLLPFMSVHVRAGAGNVHKRSGVNLTLVHAEFSFPLRFAICAHSPRICPGLDFYLSVIPGIGYGLLIQNKPLEIANHSVNGIIGATIESLRTYGSMDAGVRFGGYLYLDFLKEQEDNDPWLAYALLELGIIIRWGKT